MPAGQKRISAGENINMSLDNGDYSTTLFIQLLKKGTSARVSRGHPRRLKWRVDCVRCGSCWVPSDASRYPSALRGCYLFRSLQNQIRLEKFRKSRLINQVTYAEQ